MRRIASISIVLILVMSGLFLLAQTSEETEAAVLKVGPDQTYTSIQDAIDGASAGDTVRVYEGTYDENIEIDLSILLLGNGTGKTVINGDGSDHAVTVSASDVRVRGMTISTGSTESDHAGVYAGSGISNLTVENCNLTKNEYGIRIYASSSSRSDGTHITNCTFYDNYYSIYTYYNYNAVIKNNTIDLSDYYAVYFYHCNNGVVENNSLTNNDYGLRLYYSDYSWTGNNSIYNTEDYGLQIYYSDHNKVMNNTVNLTTDDDGIYFYSSDYNNFENNTVLNAHESGIYFSSADNNQIHNNTIKDALEDAFYHSSGSSNNIQNNSFEGAGYHFTSTSSSYWSTNTWNNNKVNNKPLVIWYKVSNKVVSSAGQVLLFDCDNINVTDKDLSNASIGVTMIDSTGCWIKNNTMNDNTHGIYCYADSSDTAQNDMIINNTILRSLEEGLYIRYSDYSMIKDNHVNGTGDYGIYFYYCDHTDLSNNFFGNTEDDGMYIYHSSDNNISENDVMDSGDYGIYLYSTSDNNEVKNNTIKRSADDGLYMSSADDNLIRDNFIEDCLESGMYISSSDDNDINNNTFKNCKEAGLSIASGSDGNDIRDNTFIGCGLDFATTSSTYWTGNTISSTNKVNGKILYFNTNTNNLVIPSTVGQVLLYSCDHATITGATMDNTSVGVYLNYCDHVTIQNSTISNQTNGLVLYYSDYVKIYNNTIENCWDYGIDNDHADQTHIFNNKISDCGYPKDTEGHYGISIDYSSNTYTENNTFVRCGVYLYGSSTTSYWTSQKMSNNTVNGRALKFLNGVSNQVLDGNVGQAIIIASDNITVKNTDLSRSTVGIIIMDGQDIYIHNITSDHNYQGLYLYGYYSTNDRVSIENSSFSHSGDYGIEVYSSSSQSANDYIIRNNTASFNGDDGMYLYYPGEDWVIENNMVINNTDNYGVYFSASSSSLGKNLIFRDNVLNNNDYGAYLKYADYGYIEDNTANNNNVKGFYIYYIDEGKVANNTANNNGDYGIHGYHSDDSVFDNNNANGNTDDGMYIYYCDPATITNNTVNNNGEDGIYAYYCDDGLDIKYNHAEGNTENGIEVYRYGDGDVEYNNVSMNTLSGMLIRGGYLDIHDNTFYKNMRYGLELEGSYADNMEVHGNFFTDNNDEGTQAYDDGDNNVWDTGSLGNYWDEWTAPDADSNGIVDVAYSIDGSSSSSDRYPLIYGIPIVTAPSNLEATEDSAYSATFDYFNADAPVIWSYETNAGWLTTGSTATITGTPTNDDVGTWWVNATATKGTNSGYKNVTITVINTNDAPVMKPQTDISIDEDEDFWKIVNAIDVDQGDTLTYGLHTNASFLSIDTSTGNVSGTPTNDNVGEYFVEVNVTDSSGEKDSVNITLSVSNTNDDPVITTSDITTAYMTIAYSVDYNATDEDPTNDVLSWSMDTNASFLSINSVDGNLSGTPAKADVGTYWVNVTVSDGNGGSDWSNFTLTVEKLNTAPSITTTDVTSVDEDSSYNVDYDADDPDTDDTLTWSLGSNATFLSINSATGVLSGTPDNSHVGTYWVNVSVSDGNGGMDWTNFTLAVNNVNDDPTITTQDVTQATEDITYNVAYQATDIDPGSDVLTWSLKTNSSFLSMISNTGILTGTPSDRHVGTWWVNVSVSDGNGGSDWSNFTLIVANVNDPPVISNSPWSNATEDQYYYFDMEVSDDDPASVGEIHTWNTIGAPSWLSIDRATGELYGTPANSDVGMVTFDISVSDGTSMDLLFNVTITVENVNDDPVLDYIPEMIYVDEDTMLSHTFTATDIDPTGDTFNWGLLDEPSWLTINSNTGVLSGMPSNEEVGIYSLNVTVSDGNGGSDRKWFNVTVNNTNDSPSINPTVLPDATEEMQWFYILDADDIDPTDDVLTWSILNASADFLSIDTATGNLSGMPDNGDVGELWINVMVSDGNGGSDIVNLTLTVLNVNDDPVIETEEIPDVVEDQEYWFVMVGSDIDPTQDQLTWTIVNTNADFVGISLTEGNISFTPTNEDVGEWWVLVQVSDGKGGTDQVNITFSVLNVNDDPEILTTDLGEATENELFFVMLEGYDMDPTNDTLTWSLSTDADFLSIDPTTGNLSGTPGDYETGQWYVTVNLSDGKGGYSTIRLGLTVASVNDPPELNVSSLDISGSEDQEMTVDLKDIFFDAESSVMSYTSDSSDNFTVTINIFGIATIEPSEGWSGTETIEFTASDDEYTIGINATVTVTSVNDPPTDPVINAQTTYKEGTDQTVTATASDPDLDYGDSLTFTWSSNISGEIGEGESINLSLPAGTHLITLNVTDSGGASIETTMVIEIAPKDEGDGQQPIDEKEEDEGFPWWIIIVAVIVILIIMILIFVLKKRKKEEPSSLDHPPEEGYGEAYPPQETTPESTPEVYGGPSFGQEQQVQEPALQGERAPYTPEESYGMEQPASEPEQTEEQAFSGGYPESENPPVPPEPEQPPEQLQQPIQGQGYGEPQEGTEGIQQEPTPEIPLQEPPQEMVQGGTGPSDQPQNEQATQQPEGSASNVAPSPPPSIPEIPKPPSFMEKKED